MLELANHRLHSLGISRQFHDTAEDVTRWMGAMQAQNYQQALWAIGLRTKSLTLLDVENAIADAKIVRTWSQRGTIHFVPAEDTKWMLDLCASRIVAGHGRRMSQLKLTEKDIAQCENWLLKALSDKTVMTRSAIFDLFEANGVKTTGQRGYHIVWHLAHHGVICMGAMDGKEQTFVLLDDWVSNLRNFSRDEALVELVWRYFASHGPATDYDFARWSGLTLTDTRNGLAENDFRLISFEHDDNTYWMADNPQQIDSHHEVHLLPAFDEYLLGYKDRSAVLPDEYADKVVPGNNGVFQPLIVVDGQVVGIWKYKIKTTSIDITLHPFIELGDTQDELFQKAENYADFLGLSLGKISVEHY